MEAVPPPTGLRHLPSEILGKVHPPPPLPSFPSNLPSQQAGEKKERKEGGGRKPQVQLPCK